ncbi:hypothetical protein BDR06DRAFT_883707 [Suillus hirtellus]|nr:hypothetical protein BDR06DRAFT_883707 [Suillus hirtellus]
MLSPLSSSGLGSCAQQDVVVKWPFHRPPPHTPGSSILKISCYVLPDEHEKLLNECNLLYWAKSLLDFTYEYIDHCINAAPTLPSFPIPCVCFGTSKQAPMADIKAGMFSAVYLLEEQVTSGTPTNDQTFMKFIHNKDYGPSLDEDEYSYDLAIFLSFTQHIQYEKTEGLAFISDYQGSTKLLTDPQILTHRSVNEGIDLFGDGNIASVVDDFKARHLCNHYCKWPGFELKVYA